MRRSHGQSDADPSANTLARSGARSTARGMATPPAPMRLCCRYRHRSSCSGAQPVSVVAQAVSAQPAGAALLMARPETLLLETSAHDPAALPVRVLRRQYLGEKTSYRVQLPGGELLQVDRHGAGHDAHQAGDAVLLSLDPEATLLLAR